MSDRRPWPSKLRTVHGDDERYRKAYWGELEGVSFTGDGARRDAEGYVTVVGRPDEVKGECVVAFVTLQAGAETTGDELRRHVTKEIGAIARPDEIRFADALPKTRSGKIMRRLLRAIAAGHETSGDTSTLEDMSVVERLKAAGVG